MGSVAPSALASTGSAAAVGGLIADGTVSDATYPDNPRDMFGTLHPDTIVVVTPGTDDLTLLPRNHAFMGKRQTLIINYPQSFWPIIAGQSGSQPFLSPTYDDSKATAISQNIRVMRAFSDLSGDRPFVIYTGYSQGADALGDAAEKAADEGLLDPASTKIVLASDPRSPWGIKSWLTGMPLLPQAAGVIGIDSNGARDPAATGEVDVVSVIVVGDPVANFQWIWYRPISSLIVNGAGFLTIHSGNGSQSYANLYDLGDPTILVSAEGNSTYVVYDAHHPLTLLLQLIHDELGIGYTSDDVRQWDRAAEAFYPIQAPAVASAAVPVHAAPSTPAPAPYSVTMPSATATGHDTGARASTPQVTETSDPETHSSAPTPTAPDSTAPPVGDGWSPAEAAPSDDGASDGSAAPDTTAPDSSPSDSSSPESTSTSESTDDDSTGETADADGGSDGPSGDSADSDADAATSGSESSSDADS
ncbi:alpha/beta hydrolase family protein [Gordonia insulae]|uniref:PE-PPE domain-containing protein n=1 Tax=Gordonia insulae TaxID=2420509 RepID=A0A3G8JIZ2_9ACTN|nr:hypothetical protein [Gordonia insulae]AZG45056.1 hypothetical protein D7316_01649 [Gordonia insulae]